MIILTFLKEVTFEAPLEKKGIYLTCITPCQNLFSSQRLYKPPTLIIHALYAKTQCSETDRLSGQQSVIQSTILAVAISRIYAKVGSVERDF
jgi:hypothetical protein